MTLLACAVLGVAYGQEEQQKSGFGLEVNAAYNFALRDLSEGSAEVPAYSVDTHGVDLTALYAINEHHAVNIRFGYTAGDDDHAGGNLNFCGKLNWVFCRLCGIALRSHSTKLYEERKVLGNYRVRWRTRKRTSLENSSSALSGFLRRR